MQVVFQCTEKPIQLSTFKRTTVVHLFPIRKDGSILLDTNGDGELSNLDASLYSTCVGRSSTCRPQQCVTEAPLEEKVVIRL